jgi:hypothetical protein
MPSPFPGMNPYFEQDRVWQTFHSHFCTSSFEALAAQLGDAYYVKTEENIYIHELSAEERWRFGRADVAISKGEGTRQMSQALGRAPVYAQLPPMVDEERQMYIEVRDTDSNDLVTVIELLSPSNKKPGPDREQYLAKRRRLLGSSTHLVEIDLLRRGPRMPLESLPQCDYCVAVSRMEERPQVGVWPIRLRDPLPVIPVPLKSGDGDARLDLGAIVNRVYDTGGYKGYIYRGLPQPPLHPDDAAWAAALIGDAR